MPKIATTQILMQEHAKLPACLTFYSVYTRWEKLFDLAEKVRDLFIDRIPADVSELWV